MLGPRRVSIMGSLPPVASGAPAVVAGYDLALVREGQEPFVPPQLQVGVVTQATLAVPDPGPAGTLWTLYARARTANGIAGEAAALRVKLVSDGTGLVPRPNSPVLTSVRPLADGDVEVRWEHDDAYATVEADGFEVFASSTGEIDYGTPVETATASDRRVVLSGLEPNVQYRVVVRAVSADGASDGNTAARMVVPRNSPPPGLAAGALLAEQV